MRLAEIHIFPVKSCAGISLPAATAEPHGLRHDRRWMVTDPTGRFLTQRVLPAMATLHATPTPDGLTLAAPGHPTLHIPTPPAEPTRPVTIWRDTVPAADAGPHAAAWLTAALATPARLVHLPTPTARPLHPRPLHPRPLQPSPPHTAPNDHVSFADGYPILLTSLASLADLNAQLDHPVPITRFRANVVIDGAPPWAEDTWRIIRIGTLTLRVAKPCERCTITTIDQLTGLRPGLGAHRLEPLRTLGRIRHDEHGIMFGQNLVPLAPGQLQIDDPVELLETGPANVTPL